MKRVFQRELDFFFIRYTGITDSTEASTRVIRINTRVLIFLSSKAIAIKITLTIKIMDVAFKWVPLNSSKR